MSTDDTTPTDEIEDLELDPTLAADVKGGQTIVKTPGVKPPPPPGSTTPMPTPGTTYGAPAPVRKPSKTG